MKKLVQIDKIVVHPGKSHADEILAVMLAEASTHNGNTVPVFRRNPTEEDLSDNRTLVLDIGGKIDDWAMVFDHHQLDRNSAPECAFSLIAKEIGAAEGLEAFFAWFGTWRMIDSKGPFAWAKDNGVDWNKVSGLLSPVSELVQDWFEEAHDDIPVDEVLVRRLQAQGRKILKAAARFELFCNEVHAAGLKLDVDRIPVYDLRVFDPDDALDNGDKLAKRDGVKGGVLVSRDNRGTGDSFYRREDDPRIDFAKCQGKEYCSFAHVGGFILKTKEHGTAIAKVIADAKK